MNKNKPCTDNGYEHEHGHEQRDNTELFRVYYSDEIQSLFYSDMAIAISMNTTAATENTVSNSVQGNVFEFIWRYLVYLNTTDSSQTTNTTATASTNHNTAHGTSVKLLTLFTYLLSHGSGIYIRSHMSVQSILFVLLQTYHSHINIRLHVSEVQIARNQHESTTELSPAVAEITPTPDKNEKVGKAAGKATEKDAKAGKTGKDGKGGKINAPEPVIELPPVVVEPVKIEPVIEEKKPVDVTAHLSDTEKWLLNKQITYDDFLLLLTQVLCSVLYIDRVDPSAVLLSPNNNMDTNATVNTNPTAEPPSTTVATATTTGTADTSSVITNGTGNISARATTTPTPISTTTVNTAAVDYTSRLLTLQNFDNSDSHSHSNSPNNEQDCVYIPTLANPHSTTTTISDISSSSVSVSLKLSVSTSHIDLLPVRSLFHTPSDAAGGVNNLTSYNKEVVTFNNMKQRLERWKNITAQEIQYY